MALNCSFKKLEGKVLTIWGQIKSAKVKNGDLPIQTKPTKKITLFHFLDQIKWREQSNRGRYRIEKSTRYEAVTSELRKKPSV